jgi:hypothetical protein
MKTVTLRDGTKVTVPNNASPATIKRLAKELVAQRRPAPKPPAPRKVEPEIIPPSRNHSRDYAVDALAQEVRELRAAVASIRPVAQPDPTPAIRELKAEFASGVDRIVSAVLAPATVVRDSNGRPIGTKKG